jgi:hypothetical protein
MPAPSITFRLPGDLEPRLRQAATASTRNLSEQVLHYVKQGLRRDGFLPSSETRSPEGT